jgi:WhiB family redox-sensing transcriptional regulator
VTQGVKGTQAPPGLNERHWGWRWRVLAACLEEDPELFYPETPAQVRKAKAVCRRCIVREECLVVALIAKDQHGIWGGLTPQERRALGQRRCPECSKPLTGRSDARYCSARCYQRVYQRELGQWKRDAQATEKAPAA